LALSVLGEGYSGNASCACALNFMSMFLLLFVFLLNACTNENQGCECSCLYVMTVSIFPIGFWNCFGDMVFYLPFYLQYLIRNTKVIFCNRTIYTMCNIKCIVARQTRSSYT